MTSPADVADGTPRHDASRRQALPARWRDKVHYLTYTGLGAAMGHMPEPMAHGIARGVAGALARRGGPVIAMHERHMRRVLASECPDGVEPDPALVRRLSKRSFDYYARYWADGARLPYETPAGVRLHWRLIEGRQYLTDAMAGGKGIVMALPHVGSWEWGGYWLALEGMPMTAVVEVLEPEELFEWFLAKRAAMGLTGVPLGEGSSGALIRALKKNEIAGLVSDRDLIGNGVEVEFFGERTTLPGGAATLAIRTGAPLIPVCVYSGPGRNWHTAVVHPPMDTTRKGTLRQDIARITQDLAHVFEYDIRRHPEQWHMYQPNWPNDPRVDAMKIAMLSPYALTRPGGVQGQVIGLSKALRGLGHDVTVVAPAHADTPFPASAGEHYVIGHPTDVHSNGSVAPVALWPAPVLRAERFIRKGGFDVVHIHEPLAPCVAYGLVATDPIPMVGTYHRAGISRWVLPLKPLVELVGRRMEVRVAVSDAARQTGEHSSGGQFEVLFNGVDIDRFESAEPVRDDHDPPRPTVLFLGRHEQRKGLSVLLDAFAMVERPAVLWVAGDGPASEVQRRRHPGSDRVHWLGTLDDDEVAARLAGADVLCAPSLHGESFGMVLLEGMAAGCAVVASDLEGYRMAAAGHAALVPPGDKSAFARALGVALADAGEGTGQSAPEARKAALEHAATWSMTSLAERYVDVYDRAIASYRARNA